MSPSARRRSCSPSLRPVLSPSPRPSRATALRLTTLLILGLTGAVLASPARAADDYKLGPDSQPRPGVPRGTVTKHEWRSQLYPGTRRDYWIYVPAQYDGSAPAAVMIFQDGAGAVKADGTLRAPVVFDNLIHARAMPVTIGIFINPGSFPAVNPALPPRSNRSAEYDTLSDLYARFLLEEILPEVGRRYRLTEDPERRALWGQSSGAICAFTVAWQRPESFRKVVSFIGSYTAIAYRPAQGNQPLRPGGDLYPTLIRKSPIKPLTVFLQDGANDLNNSHGSWFLANQQMLAALLWANANADEKKLGGPRYRVNHAWGDGGHTGKHGGALFPEILRWLWQNDLPPAP